MPKRSTRTPASKTPASKKTSAARPRASAKTRAPQAPVASSAAATPGPTKRSPQFGRAMKLVESGASGFKIEGTARTLEPADAVLVFEALAARASPPPEAPDLLAKAYARAGRFADAVRTCKQAYYPAAPQEVAMAALDAGAHADAEAAFSAIKDPSAAMLVGLALAQRAQGKDFAAALERAEQANVAKKPLDWTSATSCYQHVNIELAKAMLLAVRGDVAAAKASLAAARKTFAQNVAQKGVRGECDAQLATPADPQWWASSIARHAGLG